MNMSQRPDAEIDAGFAYRETLIERCDSFDVTGAPLWYGWVIMEAFLAGIDWERAKALSAEKRQMKRSS